MAIFKHGLKIPDEPNNLCSEEDLQRERDKRIVEGMSKKGDASCLGMISR